MNTLIQRSYQQNSNNYYGKQKEKVAGGACQRPHEQVFLQAGLVYLHDGNGKEDLRLSNGAM